MCVCITHSLLTSAIMQPESNRTSEMVAKRDLFQRVMKSDWTSIRQLCEGKPKFLTEKITQAGDTLLHLAVSDGKEEEVKELVELMRKLGKTEAMETVNERKNTALHIAASIGNVNMCNWIGKAKPDIIGFRNVDGETPFFLAATHGKLEAFLCLHFICDKEGKSVLNYARRNGGETVLHSAIHGDFFELAFVIINHYRELVDYRREDGMSPLHLLATKPTAFKSGTPLNWFQNFIYHCIDIEDLHMESKKYKLQQILSNCDDISIIRDSYPENYQTCISFFNLFYRMISVLVSTGANESDKEKINQRDAENPSVQKGLISVLASTGANESDKEKINQPDAENPSVKKGQELFPRNYETFYEAVKLIYKAMLIILGLGSRKMVKLREKKEKHTRAKQIMNLLIEHTRIYEYEDSGGNPGISLSTTIKEEDETKPYMLGEDETIELPPYFLTEDQPFPDLIDEENCNIDEISNQNDSQDPINKDMNGPGKVKAVETPLLLAARHGVKEMVEIILEKFPVAIYDINSDKKNILLVSVESRQPHVFQFLLHRDTMKEPVFSKVDKDGNSALHLAANLHDYVPWLIPGAALQMQWEIKWYEFVKTSVPQHFFARYNKAGQTPKDVFSRSHSKLVADGGKWLTKTSESCSVVAALIATVAFATSTTVPGGVNEQKGTPTLEGQPAFNVFAITSLVALCVSVTALVMFLAILTSRYQEKDFRKALPRKLLTGLSSLFISIASMLVSFCAGHFFVLKDKLKYGVYPIYAITCLPITFFAMAQFPLYFDLIRATFKKVPQRSYKMVTEFEDKKILTQQKLLEDSKALIHEARESLKSVSRDPNKSLQRGQSTLGNLQRGQSTLGSRYYSSRVGSVRF